MQHRRRSFRRPGRGGIDPGRVGQVGLDPPQGLAERADGLRVSGLVGDVASLLRIRVEVEQRLAVGAIARVFQRVVAL